MKSKDKSPDFWKITTTAIEDAVKDFFSPLRSVWNLLSPGVASAVADKK
jgi:hypothetical protein